jgi:hypothetical protein
LAPGGHHISYEEIESAEGAESLYRGAIPLMEPSFEAIALHVPKTGEHQRHSASRRTGLPLKWRLAFQNLLI